MNAADLQQLATTRVAEANALFGARYFDGAYYLAGYGVECALKACIAKGFKQGHIPKKEDVLKVYTHDLSSLLGQATIDVKSIAGTAVEISWGIVKDWRVESRYELGTTAKEAEDFLLAVTDPNDGVLQWIQKYW